MGKGLTPFWTKRGQIQVRCKKKMFIMTVKHWTRLLREVADVSPVTQGQVGQSSEQLELVDYIPDHFRAVALVNP